LEFSIKIHLFIISMFSSSRYIALIDLNSL
jgi:hypothetical protein